MICNIYKEAGLQIRSNRDILGIRSNRDNLGISSNRDNLGIMCHISLLKHMLRPLMRGVIAYVLIEK